SGGAQGPARPIATPADPILRVKKRMNMILAKNCNQPLDRIERDVDRDHYMFAEEAKAYGIIDGIVDKRA
ncbi:MAG: ATP-dependent Clp protease proteolytic subunit, partial [Clostridiales bacterium]|nr:ATP-dependent Clp protease proteolytic subunit [Clostridiales bacterium]